MTQPEWFTRVEEATTEQEVIALFVHEMNLLRAKAGKPAFRTMAKAAHVSDSTLSRASQAGALPTISTALGWARACGGNEAQWQQMWDATRRRISELELAKPTDRVMEALADPLPSPRNADPVAVLGAEEVVFESKTVEPTRQYEVGEDPPRWRRRGVLSLVAALVVAGVWFFWPEPTPSCDEVGVTPDGYDGVPVDRDAWVAAFEAKGGRVALGCPTEDAYGFIHLWGSGISQDFRLERDGVVTRTRLMSRDGSDVVVLTGQANDDYTEPHGQFAADIQGYPTSDFTRCGEALVMPLIGGKWQSGVLIGRPDGHYAWLPEPVVRLYAAQGGPAGPLGRPVTSLTPQDNGTIEFENSMTIVLDDGIAALRAGQQPQTATPRTFMPLAPFTCSP